MPIKNAVRKPGKNPARNTARIHQIAGHDEKWNSKQGEAGRG